MMQGLHFVNFPIQALRYACCVEIMLPFSYVMTRFFHFHGIIKSMNGLEVWLKKTKCRIIHSHEEQQRKKKSQ
jgi:hypothetical protein